VKTGSARLTVQTCRMYTRDSPAKDRVSMGCEWVWRLCEARFSAAGADLQDVDER
jgi:hypothetical protein